MPGSSNRSTQKLILELAQSDHSLIVTVEEAYLAGGFGSAVIELLEANDGCSDNVKVVRMGVAGRDRHPRRSETVCSAQIRPRRRGHLHKGERKSFESG